MIRLDAPGDGYTPPPARYTAALLVRRHRPGRQGRPHRRLPGSGARASGSASAANSTAGPIWRQPFAATGQPLDVDAVANYIAKYATKAADVPGLPDTRIRTPPRSARCAAPPTTSAWSPPPGSSARAGSAGDPRLRLWAHTLGYGGHFLTKSRRYSVTFGQLRRARAEHRRLERHGATAYATRGAAPSTTRVVLVVNDWTYAGRGYAPRTPGAQLALASADRARGR